MASAGGLEAVEAVRRQTVLPTGPVVVALSGGADSAVCAWAALDAGMEVRAVFVDHGFSESGALGGAARAIAARLEIELDDVAITVPSGASSEGQARTARHAALEESLKPGEVLLSGHTADDQAETVLGNVLRGTGTTGLVGIPRRRGAWARPLLGLSRSTVRAAADALDLPYLDDPSNASTEPRRNQLRLEVMPLLRERFNPELDAALSRTAAAAAADDYELSSRAAATPIIESAGVVKVPAAALATAPTAIASRLARRALRQIRGPHAGDSSEVAAVLDAVTGQATTIGGAIQVEREGPWVVLALPPTPTPAPVSVAVSGETTFWAGTILATPGVPRWRPIGPNSIVMAVEGDLTLRTAAPGERIAIGGGRKKVSTVLAEGGVPRRLRPHWPVLEQRGSIAWVVGVRTAAPPDTGGERVTLTARIEEQ